jgi:hypothetical protein
MRALWQPPRAMPTCRSLLASWRSAAPLAAALQKPRGYRNPAALAGAASRASRPRAPLCSRRRANRRHRCAAQPPLSAAGAPRSAARQRQGF